MTELYVRQYEDEIVGPKHYKDLGDDLLVTKIFYTIQGEGPFAGHPAVFVRLAGCNRGDKTIYGCQFCDTDFRFRLGRRLTVPDIVSEMMHAMWAERSKSVIRDHLIVGPLVVITGGEPMMQDNVHGLVSTLINLGWRVQIESNGDRLAPGFLAAPLDYATIVVSPKIQTARDGYGKLRPEVSKRANVLKYLVDARPDSPYHRLPDLVTWPDCYHKIMLSPITVYTRQVKEGEIANIWQAGMIDMDLTGKNYDYARRLAKSLNVRISLQTHLFLSAE